MSDDAPDGPVIPTDHATAWAIAGFVLAAIALLVAPILSGGLGMVAGSVAHLKQSRWGLPAAAASAVTMILGIANEFLLR